MATEEENQLGTDSNDAASNNDNKDVEVGGRGNPMSITLPPNERIINIAHKLAGSRNFKIPNLAACVAQDPVILMELLRIANSIFFIQDRPPITTARTAVTQLGSARVIEIITQLKEREPISDPEAAEVFESLRWKARRTSILSQIIASSIRRDLAEEAQTISLMTTMGHMLACRHFESAYVPLFRKLSRPKLTYRLKKALQFDINFIQMSYLRKYGIPEVLLFALDREIICKTPNRMALRYMYDSSTEMVEAFDANKWERYHPENELPANSSLRLIQMNERIYKKIYERCSDFLNLDEVDFEEFERKTIGIKESPDHLQREPVEEPEEEGQTEPVGEELREDEIQELVSLSDQWAQTDESEFQAATYEKIDSDAGDGTGGQGADGQHAVAQSAEPAAAAKSKLLFPDAPPPVFPKTEMSTQFEDFSFLTNEDTKELRERLSELITTAESTTDLLEDILAFLTEDGSFVRAALLVVADNRQSAHVLRAVGGSLEAGATLTISDFLSPASSCVSQVKSFNAQGVLDHISPFGISSYAVAPIDVSHASPVVLYADCGLFESLTFQSRRIFRYVVGLLNETLPGLPGTLPEQTAPAK